MQIVHSGPSLPRCYKFTGVAFRTRRHVHMFIIGGAWHMKREACLSVMVFVNDSIQSPGFSMICYGNQHGQVAALSAKVGGFVIRS
jgi:hypothetical protein